VALIKTSLKFGGFYYKGYKLLTGKVACRHVIFIRGKLQRHPCR